MAMVPIRAVGLGQGYQVLGPPLSSADPSALALANATDQQTIDDLTAGIQYRDQLIAQQGSGSLATLFSGNNGVYLALAALFVVILATGGRR